MSREKDKYNQEFKEITEKLDAHSFKDLYELETGFSFNRSRMGPCPFDNCVSGKSGRKGSDGAFKYYPSSNTGKCYSCGQAAGNVKLLMELHGFSYKEVIHYAGQRYFGIYLEDPYSNIQVKASDKKLSEYSKPTAKEIQEEEEKRLKTFNFIKEQAVKTPKDNAQKYLESRGIDTKQLPENTFFELEPYKEKPGGVVFLDSEHKFLNQRYFKVEQGMNKQFSFGELKNSIYDLFIRQDYEQLFITEGVINAASIYQAGLSACALFATTNYFDDVKKFRPYLEKKDIVIAFDFDKNYAGQKAAIKHALNISTHFDVNSVSILVFPEDEDANDLLQKNDLTSYLENNFNYVYPSQDKLQYLNEEIKKNYKEAKPVLKPDNYFCRKAVAKKEPDGYFEFKAYKEIPADIINALKGSSDIDKYSFENSGLVFIDEYTVVSNGTAHIHKSVFENPILKDEHQKVIFRPLARKPYKKIDIYEKEDFNELGMNTIKKAYAEIQPQEGDSGDKLKRILICYNILDYINLSATGEYVLYIRKQLTEDIRQDLFDMADDIIQCPANSFNEKKISSDIAFRNIYIKTFEIPYYYKSATDYLKSTKTEKFKRRLNTALPLKFWTWVSEGKKQVFKLNIIIMRNFLTKFGYHTYKSEFGPDDYIYVHINGRIVKKMDKETFPRHIETFIDKYLEKRGENVDTRDRVSVSNRLTEKNLSGLQEITLDFDNSSKNFQNFFFSDGTMWTVTEKGIIKKDQSLLKKYVWEEELLDYPSEILQAPFEIKYSKAYLQAKSSAERDKIDPLERYDIIIHDRSNFFLQFLFATSYVHFEKAEKVGYYMKPFDFWYNFPEGLFTEKEVNEMKLHLINKITWLGYYMKDFRESDEDYGLAILDAVDDLPGNRKRGAAGGGKSLITRGISEVKRTLIIKSDREDFTEYAHRYENYRGERVIVCDDMNLKNRIGNMLTDFSNGIDVNQKHKKVIPIPFHRSPKIIVTRNYIDDEGERVDRRLGRIFVFPFFHDNKSGRFNTRRKPADWFNRMLYQKDNEKDKKDLINFFARAYISYVQYGGVRPPMMDMEKFRLSRRIGEPLVDFLDNYFEMNEYGYIDRVPLFNEFKEAKRSEMTAYQRTNVYSSSQKFKALVQDYCTLRELVFNPEELISEPDKKRHKMQSETQTDKNGSPARTEHFYINKKEGFDQDKEKRENGEDFSDVEDIPEEYQQTEAKF